MVNKARGSAWDTLDNLGYQNLGDFAFSGDDVSVTLTTLLANNLPVYIPPGTWNIGVLSLPANAIVFGCGEKSILRVKNAANSINISIGSGATLSDLLVDGNKANQVGVSLHTIQLNNAVRAKLRNVKVINAKADAFNLTGAASSENILDSCSATGFLGNGFRVEQGADTQLINPNAYSSDAVSTGDGIAITSNGNAVTRVSLVNPVSKGNAGRGIALLGNGSKNVSEISIVNPRTSSNTSNGIHLINTTGVTIVGGMSISNGIDGVRLEGDVQFTRVTNVQAKSNTSFGMREVTSGSTPNNNTFAYDLSQLNGNNVITVVGGASVVVG